MKASRGSGSSGSRSLQRKRQGTPGRVGVEFEAAVGKHGSPFENVKETFSYEDVSNLATVTPVAPRAGKETISRASGGEGQKKSEVGNGKRLGETTEDTSTEEEEGGAARRRAQRRRQRAAAAVAAVGAARGVVEVGEATAAVLDTVAAATTDVGTATTVEDRRRVESKGSTSNSQDNGNSDARSNGNAVGEHAEVETASGSSAPAQTEGEAPRSGGEKKTQREEARAVPKTRRALKVPRYPNVSFTASGNASNMAEALDEAVVFELQGLIRKRGQEAACEAAVHACVDVTKEIRRQAVDIGVDLDPVPPLDIKELKRMFEEKRRRQRSRIDEEERMWAAEEAKCLALVESNQRAQARLEDDSCEKSAGVRVPCSPKVQQQPLGDPVDVVLDGGRERDQEEKEEAPLVYPDGVGTAKRVSDQLLASTNDMLLNASAIGRCLQEMGAGFADAQEAKERLGRVYQHHAFRNYPNVHDPKAGIAAMLK